MLHSLLAFILGKKNNETLFTDVPYFSSVPYIYKYWLENLIIEGDIIGGLSRKRQRYDVTISAL